ncbi:MAG: hypothetical protein U9M95_00245 [Candidatus Altiarchaeota archaeon]|nr:hypothetical protein [Candidatus Altiarchaeota archaeon]
MIWCRFALITKYYNSTIQVTFPYSKNPETSEKNYTPFVAYPFGDMTYDKDMEVRIIQEDPLIIEFKKELIGSDSPLISVIPLKLLPTPQLKIRQQDIVDLNEGKRFCNVDITNTYEDRKFYVLRDKDDRTSNVIIQNNEDIDIKTDRIYSLPSGETRNVVQEKVISNDIKLLNNTATESYLLANYLKAKEEPTDFYMDYFMSVEVPNDFVLDEEKSYLEIKPTHQRRIPRFFLFLEASGTHKISTSPIVDKKIVKFHELYKKNKYESEHIQTLMNTPAYELNVTYLFTIKEDPETVKTRNDILIFQVLLAIFGPPILYYFRSFMTKHGHWENKEKYYMWAIVLLISSFLVWSAFFGSPTHLDYFIFNPFLWLMLLVFSVILIKENVFPLKDYLKKWRLYAVKRLHEFIKK